MSERIPPFTLPGGPANDNANPLKTGHDIELVRAAESILSEVFLRYALGEGRWSESVRIGLTSDKQADLSGLPEELRKKFEQGIDSGLGMKPVKPEDGVRFLAMLFLTNRNRTDLQISTKRI